MHECTVNKSLGNFKTRRRQKIKSKHLHLSFQQTSDLQEIKIICPEHLWS